MEYTQNVQVTEYKGIMFRSHLEACWAKLFDDIGIAWEYAPDWASRPGWAPDFAIQGQYLVEVKPVPALGADMATRYRQEFDKAIRDFPTILLGSGPGKSLGCLVKKDGTRLIARTVFFDPKSPMLLRSVAFDGYGDRCWGNLEMRWRESNVRGERAALSGREAMRRCFGGT